MRAYHDDEWATPVHDDQKMFELLTLEGAQAGLSWTTVLRKRARYVEVFHGFDIDAVAAMTPEDVERLLLDPGIIRNRAKVESTITNARVALELDGGLAAYLWTFVGGEPIKNDWVSLGDIPAETPESKSMSKDLKRRGLRFVGPTICYALMQAAGLVDDHVRTCFRRAAGAASGASAARVATPDIT